MNDLIYRQAAIDEIENYEATAPDYMQGWAVKLIEAIKGDIRGLISELPSAQPRWIPASERLPDEFGEYLVTKKAIGWNCEKNKSNDIAYFDNEGFHKAEDVLAWMPLPEPWKGEEP